MAGQPVRYRQAMIQFNPRDPTPSSSSPARFQPGQLVRHRRYGYRGVVAALDLKCRADEQWYQSNKTQPGRDQPWYHVLVHGSHQTTYAAESSLMPDRTGGEIAHPLVEEFFSEFVHGAYVRNSQPWPQ
ncbi:MAG: heat shock protein HspQ [Chlamydiales bacterium]|jgi:heat shock protein HspQ